MVDARLVQQVNRGRCFALVGSGPSCEIGYPSWRQLADDTYHHVKASGRLSDVLTYEKYLADRAYPELFRQAEDDLGGRPPLVEFLRTRLRRKRTDGLLYDVLTRWPFACYLTTNFDDELADHLTGQQTYFRFLSKKCKRRSDALNA